MAVLQAAPGLLEDWVLAQRWYAGKGSSPRLREIASWRLPGDEDTDARVCLLLDESADPPRLYQVPLTFRPRAAPGLGHALIGVVERDGAEAHVYDGMHDPLFAQQLLELIARGGRADGDGATATGIPLRTLETRLVSSDVVDGEQSNTSVVFRLVPAEDGNAVSRATGPAAGRVAPSAVVCKLFRILQSGVNPDVELQSALTAIGSRRVPETIGSIVDQWPDAGGSGQDVSGHLAFAQVFVEHAQDAWRLALAAAESGEDFTERAEEIGRATAEVHQSLATVLQTRAAAERDIIDIRSRWHRRLQVAIREVPELARFERAVERVYNAASLTAWPDLQRVHGDLHLGQVLIAPDGSCVIIDFEGEPIRPLLERSQPDLALRDVAGMLRSFDYVGGALAGSAGVGEWALAARTAFLAGYTGIVGVDLIAHHPLLDALELDKAVYEALYEARHRPSWLPIPTRAIARLVERSGGVGTE